ncbi:shikimate O-hydroxycinnamoyltransferase-like [Dendrobium catenatum]|uniref:shikimate O-hydroxycinnamoyltransferase-like n=1 Tax=Dendrobium catenatum TaxID=906689 RepID=UPI00109EE966|nr:shikimate O-hydroxycinnamoyltransferase-like [Dendrobium catenatum]
MAKMVKVVNSCLVPPALPTPRSPIWLSNLDLFAAPTHVRVVCFFRNTSSDPSFPSPAASIKASLARVLVSYYPFAGRFAKLTHGRLEISCTGKGALFFEAVSNLTLDEFGVYKPSLDNCRLLVPTDGFNALERSGDSIPILMVQLTTFKCGGLCLGTALHHQASDGIAATRFMCDWADTTRDPTRPIPTPYIDRTSLRARSPPTVQFHHPEFDLRERPEKQEPVSFTFLNVTAAQLVAVKAACGDKYTSFESMAAHIWRCTCLARGPVRLDEEIRLVTTADLRRRLSHTIPSDFVGNAITVTVAIAPAAEVASGLRAARIRDAIEKLDEEYLRSVVDYLELQEDKRRLARSAGNFAATDISVGSWHRLPLNEVDFGWGPPEFMGPATFIYPRQFLILSSPDGGVKVCCSLETEKMDSFVKLFHELLPVPAAVV